MKIVLAGGTGHIGQSLRQHFAAHEMVVLTRSPKSPHERQWDGATLGDWGAELDSADVLINLAGRSVNCRYNEANKKEILESRTNSVRVLGEAIEKCQVPPKVWLQMSTATLYDHRFDAPNDEATGLIGQKRIPSPAAWGFSITVAKAWEQALEQANVPQTRKVCLRSAMVMAPIKGSVLDVLVTLAKRGLLGRLASGEQYMSWIHADDFCRSIEFLIQSDLSGAVNISSPNPIPQVEFAKVIRERLGIKLGLPATAWMIEIGTAVMSTQSELVLKSRRVVPGRLLEAGFKFEHPEWPEALDSLARQMFATNTKA